MNIYMRKQVHSLANASGKLAHSSLKLDSCIATGFAEALVLHHRGLHGSTEDASARKDGQGPDDAAQRRTWAFTMPSVSPPAVARGVGVFAWRLQGANEAEIKGPPVLAVF